MIQSYVCPRLRRGECLSMSEANQKKIHCRIIEVPEGTVRETDYSFAKEALETRRNHQPPISYEQMKADYPKEIQLLKKGLSLRNVQAITNTSVNTLRKLHQIITF